MLFIKEKWPTIHSGLNLPLSFLRVSDNLSDIIYIIRWLTSVIKKNRWVNKTFLHDSNTLCADRGTVVKLGPYTYNYKIIFILYYFNKN